MEPRSGLRTILYVEDEPSTRHIARIALEHVGGYSVTVCQSGFEALAVAPELKPDLILLDVMMPDLNGPDILANLRAFPSLAETPVIFVTAKTLPSDIELLLELGALDVIQKPFDPMALPLRVREVWSRPRPRRQGAV
jgi:DNA-binding response OmpR family regulator